MGLFSPPHQENAPLSLICPCSSQHFDNWVQPKSQTTEPAQNPCHSDVASHRHRANPSPNDNCICYNYKILADLSHYNISACTGQILDCVFAFNRRSYLLSLMIFSNPPSLPLNVTQEPLCLTMTMLERKTLRCQLQCDIIPKHSHNGNIYPPMSLITPLLDRSQDEC